MRIITVKVPKAYVDELDNLIKAGLFPSRSEAIRVAIRDLLQRELWSVKNIELRKAGRRGSGT